MSLPSLLAEFSAHLQSPEFRQIARHPDHPKGFSRDRKMPLHVLVAFMLTGLRMSVQAELDQFFAHLMQQAQLMRVVTEQAFAQARVKLALDAIPKLNGWLLERAAHHGFIPRWRGLRLVAADASAVRFGLRASHVKRAALPNQILFGLFLPGAELMLAHSLHDSKGCGERQMLFQHLDQLSNTDLLLLDRGYPARWLISLLNSRDIPFCMRVERSGTGGFACVRAFLHSNQLEQIVTVRAPNRKDAEDYECPRKAQKVRLVRHVAPNGNIRVLMTNLLDTVQFPANCFGDLYHQRWRIEEAFKRLKHRLNLEHVSGLSQQAVLQDVAAKIVTDNLQALASFVAHEGADLDADNRINHAYAHTVLKRLMPAILLGKKVAKLWREALALIAGQTYIHRENLSKERKARPKPHKGMTQKQC